MQNNYITGKMLKSRPIGFGRVFSCSNHTDASRYPGLHIVMLDSEQSEEEASGGDEDSLLPTSRFFVGLRPPPE